MNVETSYKMKIEKAKIFRNIYVYYLHTSDLCLNLIIHTNLFYIFSYSYIRDYIYAWRIIDILRLKQSMLCVC